MVGHRPCARTLSGAPPYRCSRGDYTVFCAVPGIAVAPQFLSGLNRTGGGILQHCLQASTSSMIPGS